MSSAVSSAATQQKFSSLRKRLDQLGYKQPLGLESLPLVERLFTDLLHTTDSLKKSKLQLSSSSTDVSHIDSQIEPYKSDNAKLVKETNELHKQLIKSTEESQQTIKDLKSSIRKLEHDSADLKFLNNQYVHKIRALEQESQNKSDKILQLQEKNFHAVVQTPGGHKKNIPFRRQRMEIDSLVPPAPKDQQGPPMPVLKSDPYVADLLKIADSQMAEMKEEAAVHKEEKEGLEGRIRFLKQQVDTRDTEIDRLSRLLEGGRPHDVVALEARNRSNERLIAHLNIQIDYLQQKNKDLQLQVDKAVTQAATATEQTLHTDVINTQLSQQLHDTDIRAQRLRLDRESVERTADIQLTDANIELNKARDELENMDLQIAQLKAESERLRLDNSDMKAELAAEQVNRDTMDVLLQRVQEDKHKLGRRINKLLANEKELVLEIDRLKHHRSCAPKKKGQKSVNRVESLLKSVEQERDYWKGEVEVLQKMLTSRARPTSPMARSPARSPTRSARSPARSPTRSPASPNRSLRSSRGASPAATARNTKMISNYESTIRLLEEERDQYKHQCEVLRASRSVSPARKSKSVADSVELTRVIQERDELQRMLDKFERHMSEIQANVKVLTSERDKLNILYEETRDELTRLRRDVIRSPKSPKTSLAAQAVLRRVENERDDALNELRRITTERDTLRERLKIATETQLGERSRMEQKVEDLEHITRSAERERSEQATQSEVLRSHLSDVQSQLDLQRLECEQSKDEAAQQKATATQMRLLAEQTEHALEDAKHTLGRREVELRNAQDKIVSLEQRLTDITQTLDKEHSMSTQLRSTITALDREKDSLQINVDDKTERVVALQQEIDNKEKTIQELRTGIADLEASLVRSQDMLVSKDHEITSLRRQLDGTAVDLTETGRAKDVAIRENRRLQDDLANMTRENQSVNADLQATLAERERLKAQVQEYVGEVKRTEELLAAKDVERSDILEQYRNLSLEAEKYETANHQLESESSNLRLELMTRENETRRLRERIEMLERDIKDLMHTERSYDVQVSSLTKSVATLEDTLRACDNDKHTLMQDLSAVRDLCTQLEAAKDSLQRQLTSSNLDKDKLEAMLEDSRRESDVLRTQMNSERSSMKNLENLLSSEREKDFHLQLSQQEQAAEIQLLRDKLALNDTKMESHMLELSSSRTQIIELEAEVERVKRQLTNERFERERAAQELRRHGISSPSTATAAALYSSPSAMSRSRSPAAGHRSTLRSPITDPVKDLHSM